METPNFKVRAIGEIAIRCIDHGAMVAFYRDVIGLSLMNDPKESPIVFFRVADGFEGHTAVLALFRHDVEGAGGVNGSPQPPGTGSASSLHHLALSLAWDDQDAVMDWYDRLGLAYDIEYFDWVGWRGIFTRDPDGNTVELVAKDPDYR
ncbi:VOC family protein [Roseivivax sp. GX 12232]|uniref:VOC family protein n=1 Tax=Roseivivax sp. GX 12232 TaxID=2900547 RepID=UPI001E491945|nr:VOC family protein [Roseivivax sp. GX 12232]MCE0504892.1 VOC family protein [Roseivivax sp. GX 12232]